MFGFRFVACLLAAAILNGSAFAGSPARSSAPEPWAAQLTNARNLCQVGKFAEAIDAYTLTISSMKSVSAPLEWIARGYDELAITLKVVGRFDEAEKDFLRALELMQRVEGHAGVRVGILLSDIGAYYVEQGQLARAERYLLASRNVLAAGHETPLFCRAAILQDLGAVYYRQGRTQESEAQFREAVALLHGGEEKDRPQLAVALGDLAQVLIARGSEIEGGRHLKESIAIFESLPGQFQSNYFAVLVILANLQRSEQDAAAAENTCDRLLEMGDHVLGPDNPRLTNGLDVCSLVYKSQHRKKEAKLLASRAQAIRDQAIAHSSAAKTVDIATLTQEASH